MERIQQATRHYLTRATDITGCVADQHWQVRRGAGAVRPCRTYCAIWLTRLRTRLVSRASLSLAAPPTLPVAWDRLATEQIIDNLVSNAIKYGAQHPHRHLPPMGLLERSASRSGTMARHPGRDRSRVFRRFERLVGGGRAPQRLRRRPVGGPPTDRSDGRRGYDRGSPGGGASFHCDTCRNTRKGRAYE